MKEKNLPTFEDLAYSIIFSSECKPTSIVERQSLENEHQKKSSDIYCMGKELLDRYGRSGKKNITIVTGTGGSDFHFETVNYRTTPIVGYETKNGKAELYISEDFTVAPNHPKKLDSIKINVFFDGKEVTFFDISKTKKETRNWFEGRASLEQMKIAEQLLLIIEKSLEQRESERLLKILTS
jgi:hypothetical protein